MLFLLKKIITLFAMPMTISMLILLIGIIIICFTRKQKTGKLTIILGFIILIFFSLPFVANKFTSNLELRYPPFTKEIFSKNKDVKYIVVLGGGVKEDDSLPISSRLGEESLNRLIEAILLHKKYYPEAKLLLSGAGLFGCESEAEIMKTLAISLGIKNRQIILDTISKDTESQAKKIRSTVKEQKFILVTSAIHISRAIMLFKKYGMSPIPAPTAYDSFWSKNFPGYYFPSPGSLGQNTLSFHEYLGILWIKIKALFNC